MKELIDKIKTLNVKQLELVEQYINNLLNPKKHRSLSQNAYMWELINQMANKLNRSKEDVYLELLKDYGSSVIISMLSSIEPDKYFKYYEVMGKSKINNKEFTHYKYFKGSSEYDTAEMAHLLDGVIQECENMGIPTLSEEDIRKMRII